MSSTPYNPATLDFIQKDNARRSKQRKIATAVGAVLVLAIAVSGYFGMKYYNQSMQEARAKELAAKIAAAGPGPGGFEEIRKAIDSGEITRDQAWAAGREAREKMEQERMNAYFNLPAKERDKYLDKLLDEMQKRMKEREARQATQPTTRPNWGPPRDGNGPTSRPAGGRGGGFGGGRGDNASPQQRAMQSEFRAAMERRAKERGMSMPGRGFGGGGFGGGRGRG